MYNVITFHNINALYSLCIVRKVFQGNAQQASFRDAGDSENTRKKVPYLLELWFCESR